MKNRLIFIVGKLLVFSRFLVVLAGFLFMGYILTAEKHPELSGLDEWLAENPRLELVVIILGMSVLAAITAFFYWLHQYVHRVGRKLVHLSASERLLIDPRPPILYIRSFADDQKGIAMELYGSVTEEESLVQVLNKVGPVFAIGKPGETLPTLGAARVYVSDDDWKDVVSDMMDKACFVFCRIGNTSGLEYEMKLIRSKQISKKVILILPTQTLSEYNQTRSEFEDKFTIHLPDIAGAEIGFPEAPASYKKANMMGFITFGNDWIGEFYPIETYMLSGKLYWSDAHLRKMEQYIKISLKPIMEKNNIDLYAGCEREANYGIMRAILYIVGLMFAALIMQYFMFVYW